VIGLRAIARRAYFAGARATGSVERRGRAATRSRALLILNLHRVSPESSPLWPPLHPRLFEDLLRFLRRRAHVVTFADLPDQALTADGRPLVMLSFDDGYRDFIDYAMPVLERFGIRANQNVIPGSVQTGRPPWTVELADALTAAPPALLRGIVGSASGRLGVLPGGDTGRTLITALKSLPRLEREQVWPELEPLIREAPGEGTAMMTVSEVREAAERHEIGVHSFSHESMEHESDEYFLEDLHRCRTFFDRELRSAMRIYAFPNGSYRDGQIELLRREGIEHVLLVGERPSSPASRVHHRFTFGGSSRSEVRLRAMGWTRPS
jgi:peptidoglycan/xylan/chitin deacetylase (PgdA/CDA1 family)